MLQSISFILSDNIYIYRAFSGTSTQLAVSTTLITISDAAIELNPNDRKCWKQDEDEIQLDNFPFVEDYR